MVAFDMVKAGTEALELNDVVTLHWLIHIKMHARVHTCTEHLQAVPQLVSGQLLSLERLCMLHWTLCLDY